MLVETIIFITTIACLLWYWITERPIRKGKRLPGPISFPFIGSSLQIALSPRTRNYEIFEDLALKYGRIYGFRAGINYVDFKLGKEIMASEDWSARTPPLSFIYERSFNKNLGLIWSHGENWKDARRYTIRQLRQFGFGKTTTMEKFIDEEVQIFVKMLDAVRGANGNLVSMHNIFTIPVMNLTWSMMAGIRFSNDDSRFREILNLIQTMNSAIRPGVSALHAFPFLRFIPGLTEHDVTLEVHVKMQAMFKNILGERRAKGTYMTNPADFIDKFLHDIDTKVDSVESELFTDEQLIMVCIDLFFTSSDTTSAALEFALLYMTINPNVMQKVKDEIEAVLGGKMPELCDKSKMPYIEATTLEILRYSSINPVAGRASNKDSYIDGYFIPKNSAAAILMHKNHFNEQIWNDPYEFRPERFLSSNNEIINADKITPFGFGKRLCIGETLARASFFKFFTVLMQRYDFEASSNPNHKLSIEPRSGLTNTPQPYHIIINSSKL